MASPVIRGAMIDVGDGTVISAPPATPAPPPSPAPPPVIVQPASSSGSIPPDLLAAAGVTQAQVDEANAAAAAAAAGAAALLAGGGSSGAAAAEQAAGASQEVVDALLALGIPNLGDVLPAGPGDPGGLVGETDDLGQAEAIADANDPDLSDLPPWELVDPFGLQLEANTNPPLKGGGAISAIAQACADYGVDALAAIADALHEGANGGIGDGGLAYGPFQDHLTEYADRPFFGKGRNNPVVNAWAWSENGIRYSVRAMVNGSPSAKGLRGHPAVYAIVYGYERPADKAGAYKTRAAEYDHLVALGSKWPAYAADLFAGPQAGGAVDTTPIAGTSLAPYTPANVVGTWRDLVDVFAVSLPKQRAKVKSQADALVEVFK